MSKDLTHYKNLLKSARLEKEEEEEALAVMTQAFMDDSFREIEALSKGQGYYLLSKEIENLLISRQSLWLELCKKLRHGESYQEIFFSSMERKFQRNYIEKDRSSRARLLTEEEINLLGKEKISELKLKIFSSEEEDLYLSETGSVKIFFDFLRFFHSSKPQAYSKEKEFLLIKRNLEDQVKKTSSKLWQFKIE